MPRYKAGLSPDTDQNKLEQNEGKQEITQIKQQQNL